LVDDHQHSASKGERPVNFRRIIVWTTLGLMTWPVNFARGEQPCRVPVRDHQHIVSKYPASWMELKTKNVVMQQRDWSCGAAALATLTRYYWGDNTSEDFFLKEVDKVLKGPEIEDRLKNGLTMTDLRKAAVGAGYDSTIGTLSFDKLVQSKVPLIVGIEINKFKHFVVYRGFDGYYVYLADSIRGKVRVPAPEFVSQWQKNAVLVVAKRGAEPKAWAPLLVSKREAFLGELNGVVVQKDLSRPALQLPFPQFGQ
jgi:predicted double-glycine peptidase